jgi:acetyl esterase
MPLDPAIDNMLQMLAAAGSAGMAVGTPEQARALFDQMTVMLAAASPGGVRTPVGAVSDAVVAGVPVRVYRPQARSGPVPTTVMFHGGGFVIGNIASHDDQARLLVTGTGGVVVSVEYRLAPEAPYPAAREDCEAVTRAVLADLDSYGGDPARVGIAGDSAGGNLSAVVAQRLRDAPAAYQLAAQLLWYPAVDMEDDGGARYPSRVENAEGYFLTTEDMRWFSGHYLPTAHPSDDPGSSPLRGHLEGLPPAVVATAEFDPLRDEGEAYAAALEKAGVHVVARRYDGLIHGFVGMGVLSPACQAATDDTIAAYAALLG